MTVFTFILAVQVNTYIVDHFWSEGEELRGDFYTSLRSVFAVVSAPHHIYWLPALMVSAPLQGQVTGAAPSFMSAMNVVATISGSPPLVFTPLLQTNHSSSTKLGGRG